MFSVAKKWPRRTRRKYRGNTGENLLFANVRINSMTILSTKSVAELILRVNKLQPDSKGSWGRMTVEEMMVHCVAGIQLGLGELPAKIRVDPVRAALARLLFVDFLPLPKLAQAPPEMNVEKKLKTRLAFNDAKEELIRHIKKMETVSDQHQFPVHPIFRKLSRRQWSKLAYKHLDHHLKQFGV